MAYPPRDAFQIGWICALPIEAAAAAEMLDEHFGILEEQDAADSNTYTLGRIGKHHVVIACLPGGQYGTTSATTVANNMVRTFSNSLRVGLMVGIGGGIPSAAHDIRLGDIVISYPQGTCGGVIQYDMGKVVAGGEFERTGSLNSPPRALLTAVGTMRAAALSDEPRYPEYLQKAIRRTARTRKNFGRPAVQCDRLFQAKHDHPVNASSCDGCPAEWEEIRNEREDRNPQPHYGIIASGDYVIKHGETREQLRSMTGALCFEMEAAGLMLDFACIVVRGVCDYADSHKNKQWQGYAALAAASYTKELLAYIPVGHVLQEALAADVCTGLKEEIRGTNQRLDGIKSQQDQHHREQTEIVMTGQQQSCHQTFKVANYTEQKNINPKRAEGTCQWALQSPEYIRWSKSNSNDFLWVSADPGCGKSVLARSIIDDYEKASSPTVTICYFFFKDNDEQNRLTAALCSILHQFFSQRPHLLHYAMPSWEKNGEKLRQEVEELWRVFTTAASAEESCETICIFDALDECWEVDQCRLIEKLELFHRQSCPAKHDTCLKFLVTSRPYDHIQNRFREITTSFPRLNLKGEVENDQIHKEINLVVKLRVKELVDTAQLSWDIQQRLEQQLLRMEHRTYLWLHLAIDEIRSRFQDSPNPDEVSIQMIPSSVGEAYEKILNRVPPGQLENVRNALRIIVATRRPLTTTEMAMALGIAIHQQSSSAAQAGLDSIWLGKWLRRVCGLFVFINNSKIYLIHQTAREFLLAKSSSNKIGLAYSWSLGDSEDHMARICLRYLLMEDLVRDDDRICSSAQDFLDYSAVHWPDHVRKMDLASDQKAVDRVHRLYDMSGKLFSLWFPIFWKAAGPYEIVPYENVPTLKAMHLAAFNGHEEVVQYLLGANKGDVNIPDSTGTYAVVWASWNGHEKIVQLLLKHGADVNTQGGFYRNPLYAASSRGYDKTVQLLLEHGADVNTQGGFYRNPLYAASSRGYDKIVRLLLEHGADVNTQGGDYGNALYAASSSGYDKIVQLLLEHGADANAQGRYGNALHAASSRGYDKIVQLLLEYGADANAQGRYGNALHAASSRGYDKIVQLLLEYGADANAPGGDYGNTIHASSFDGYDRIIRLLLEHAANANTQGGYEYALYAASSKGYDKIVQLLLEHGADANAQGGDYGNALHAASSRGYDKIVQLLLEHGADANAHGGGYGNVLQASSYRGHDEIVQLLLEHGADVNAQGGDYGNALNAASSEGHDKIVQLLLDNGADANAQSGYGNGLSAASSGGHDKIVQLLLDHGADANAQGGGYGNGLSAASFGGHDRIVQLLLDHGADVNAEGGIFGNALYAASFGGYDKIVQLLLEHGAEVNAQGGGYGNALYAASSRRRDKIVQLLLDHGADVNAQGGEYGNALHAASSEGYNNIVQLLLEHGADANTQSGDYGNALYAASSRGYDKIVQLLLEHRADVNAQGGDYGNALNAASSRGYDKIVQLLLKHGADVKAQDRDYGNALHVASSEGHCKIVQLLLEHGADVNAQGGICGNALRAASSGGHDEIVQILQRHPVTDQPTPYLYPSKRPKLS
ncbi:hypothetical protein N7492_000845 [Penicillium capsulatum]|uniref:Nucleoside phosphorylase domain-containing protein n=1 Tax=Penicillium capsulatum TaxID=69766 RepID=A0A9W9ISK7_9EURO|nr:hypothetical protein N7492_000845 [Penicillium capsulatum]KAJ6130096.1 hypothetical protein N7512_002876 [Penicillium capsulatum]